MCGYFDATSPLNFDSDRGFREAGGFSADGE